MWEFKASQSEGLEGKRGKDVPVGGTSEDEVYQKSWVSSMVESVSVFEEGVIGDTEKLIAQTGGQGWEVWGELSQENPTVAQSYELTQNE